MEDNKYVDYIKKYWSRPIFASLTIFVLFFGLLVTIFVISEGDPIPDDQYFHFKYAYLLRTQGWDVVEHFRWIQSSPEPTGGGHYAVNLFQGSLIPFTYFSDWLLGLRVAEAFYASIVVALIYYIMRKERVRYPLFFTLLLASSTFFMARILLGRAFVLILGLIFLEMHLAIHRKYIPLIVIVILHVLWHQNTYFLPFMMVGIVEFSRYFVEKKIDIKNMFVTVCGIIVGMMFFPGFPRSLISRMSNLFGIKENISGGSAGGALGGGELITVDFSSYFLGEMTMFILLVGSIGLLVFLYFKQKEDEGKKKRKRKFGMINKTYLHWVYSLLIFLSIVLFGSMMIMGRFFDFVFPAAVLLSAFIVAILLESKFISLKNSTIEWMSMLVWVFVDVLFAGAMFIVYKKSNTFDYEPAKLAAQWIDENSDAGEKVYLNNWSNFNMMFFANSNNVYSMGIEPYSLRLYDESLYWKYYNLFKHKYYCELQGDCEEEIVDTFENLDEEQTAELVKENGRKVVNSIKNDFGANFIVSDSKLLNVVVSLNPELIEDQFEIRTDKFDKKGHMEFMVFKLK